MPGFGRILRRRNTKAELAITSMTSTQQVEVIDGVTFELGPLQRGPVRKRRVCLRKSRYFVDRYLALSREFSGCRMVEIGVDRGGSTAFFCKLLNPLKMVAIELSEERLDTLEAFLARHDPEGRVEVHWGVDQANRSAVPDIVREAFGSEQLDFVVDDASHRLAPSTASFEMLFPRLREGGLYILEDWSGVHHFEHSLRAALKNDPEGGPAHDFVAKVKARQAEGGERDLPMSILICQLVIASGYQPDWISDIRIADGFCEVRRGPGEIPIDTPLPEYTGMLGHWIFENRLS